MSVCYRVILCECNLPSNEPAAVVKVWYAYFTRHDGGLWYCIGHNVMGSGDSEAQFVDVLCEYLLKSCCTVQLDVSYKAV